jgi:hypothetical protein
MEHVTKSSFGSQTIGLGSEFQLTQCNKYLLSYTLCGALFYSLWIGGGVEGTKILPCFDGF